MRIHSIYVHIYPPTKKTILLKKITIMYTTSRIYLHNSRNYQSIHQHTHITPCKDKTYPYTSHHTPINWPFYLKNNNPSLKTIF